jgi:hypothetical protein
MTNEDAQEIKRLLSLRVADMRDKNSAQSLINKYISEGSKWCMTCDPAVKQMFGVLKNWATENGLIKTNE